MAKQVSQEYYIETVRSSMELMDLNEEEAIKDTLESFKLQGIDTSNLDINCLDPNASRNLENMIQSLKNKEIKYDDIPTLIDLLSKEAFKGLQQRVKLGSMEIIPILLRDLYENVKFRASIMECCSLIVNGNPDVVKSELITKVYNDFLKEISCDPMNLNQDLVLNQLKFFYNVCCKHEDNRKTLFSLGVMQKVYELLAKQLNLFPNKSGTNADQEFLCDSDETEKISKASLVSTECCRVLRVLVKDDDVRAEFGQGCMNAVKFSELNDFFEKTIEFLTLKKFKLTVVVQLIYTLNFTVVREESCQRILKVSGLELILGLFSHNPDKVTLINALIDFMNVLSHSDEVREKMSKITINKQQNILSVLFNLAEESLNNGILVRSIMLLFSNVTLRQTENGKSLILMGLPQLTSMIFNKYKQSNPGMMRAVCLTIRNSIDKNRHLAPLFVPKSSIVNPRDVHYIDACEDEVRDLEIERHLNDLIKTNYCSDEAKSAARDLGLKVDLKNAYIDK